MAAMQLAMFRIEGKLPLKAAFGADDPICELPAATAREQYRALPGPEQSDLRIFLASLTRPATVEGIP